MLPWGDDGLKLGGLEKPKLIGDALEGAPELGASLSNAEDGIPVGSLSFGTS